MRRAFWIAVLVLVLLVAVLGTINYLRPVPLVQSRALVGTTLTVGQAPSFTWPQGTEDAIGTASLGVLAQTPSQSPQPTGSVAKVMTALVVLQKMPLAVGQQGPSITISAADQATQEQDAAAGQSTVPVVAGEVLTEYQALQGMLLPSGNNLAVLLAGWAYGSIGAALTAMTSEAKELGLAQTTFTDPSGFDPSTTSTPADLVRLGAAAMQNPVIAQVVGQAQATLPVAGQVDNVNSVLGQAGIVGIKTGNTTGQNGAFLFAAPDSTIPGQLIVGAVMGGADLNQALADSVPLVEQAQQALRMQTILAARSAVAEAGAPWDETVPISTEKTLSVAAWGGRQAHLEVRVKVLAAPIRQGEPVGTLTVTFGSRTLTTPLVTAAPLTAPPWNWRLLRRPPYVPAADWPD
ncbi:MAG: D-alanyl-D-alanine carboxypeptidase family protein [Candidatus Dormibacteraceae bacterium]